MDRNTILTKASSEIIRSLSARRAWIEIMGAFECAASGYVALRKESVDRNVYYNAYKLFGTLSLSARRAWIEMVFVTLSRFGTLSLSARRAWIEIKAPIEQASKRARRSPQGERG